MPKGPAQSGCRANWQSPAPLCWGTTDSRPRSLTLELSGRRRYDARARAEKMDEVPQPGPWWHAVGAPLERLVRPHPHVHRPTRLCSVSCRPPGLPAPRCRRRRGRISSRRASAVAEEANAGPGGPMNWLTIIAAYAVRCSDLVRWLQVVVFARPGTVFRPRLAFCSRCPCSSRVPGSDRPCCA